jgi:hypothetical protein
MNAANASPVSWKVLPNDLRLLTVLLASGSVAAVVWSFFNIGPSFRGGGWLVLTAFALLTVLIGGHIPYGRVSFEEPFLMAIAIMYGTSGCVLAAACFAAASLLPPLIVRRKLPLFIIPFHFGVVCSAFLYSSAYRLTSHSTQLNGQLLPAALMAVTGFLFATLVTAKAASWQSGEKFWPFWRRVHLPLLVNDFLGAGCALVIANWPPWGVLAYFPTLHLISIWMKKHSNRLTGKAPNLDPEKSSTASAQQG